MGFGWVFMIIFWAVIILAVVFLVKAVAGGARREGRGEMPLDILKRRYARGEITREEFEKMKDDLSS
ncbi:MAG: SHOCT domain-containing protein [Thermodesulfovibrionales bacterium]